MVVVLWGRSIGFCRRRIGSVLLRGRFWRLLNGI